MTDENISGTALVLVGHGSNLPDNKQNITVFCDMLKKRDIYPLVEVSFLQKNDPSLLEILNKLIIDGIERIIVLPVFLAKGVHTQQDIPKVIEKATNGKKVEIVYAEPLGVDERIADILLDRASEALKRQADGTYS